MYPPFIHFGQGTFYHPPAHSREGGGEGDPETGKVYGVFPSREGGRGKGKIPTPERGKERDILDAVKLGIFATSSMCCPSTAQRRTVAF